MTAGFPLYGLFGVLKSLVPLLRALVHTEMSLLVALCSIVLPLVGSWMPCYSQCFHLTLQNEKMWSMLTASARGCVLCKTASISNNDTRGYIHNHSFDWHSGVDSNFCINGLHSDALLRCPCGQQWPVWHVCFGSGTMRTRWRAQIDFILSGIRTHSG